MQDNQIIESVIAGDIANYELLVMKYQSQLMYVAYNITKNRESAEDMVQEAFIKAYEKLHTLSNHAGFYAWIKRIVINLCLNLYDRGKWVVDVSTGEDSFDFFDNIPTNNDPASLFIKDETQKYLTAFIDALPDKLRLVFVLREVEEYSYEEISDILKIPIGTVRSRLFNARQVLKERLIKQGLADGVYEISEL